MSVRQAVVSAPSQAEEGHGRPHVLRRAVARAPVVVAGLFLLGLGLRLYGFWWGKPYSLHNDEAFVLAHTIKLLRHVREGGLPDPETMIYGVWPFYQLALAYTALNAVGGWLGLPTSVPLMYVGRWISAFYGAAGVVALYALGKRLYGVRAGLWAAAFWAVMPLSVRDSHFATVDVQFAVWLVVVYFALWRIVRHGRWRDFLLAGGLVGLTLAVRLSALPLLGALFLAHLLRVPPSQPPDTPRTVSQSGAKVWSRVKPYLQALRSPRPYVAVLVALGTWAFLSLPVLDDLPAHLAGDTNSDLNVQSLVARGVIQPLYTVQFDLTRPYLYHLTDLFPWGMGWPLALLAYAGWIYSLGRLLRGDRRDWLLASWTVPYFLTVGGWYVKFIRYIIPLLPFLALYAARLVAQASEGRPPRWVRRAFGLVAVGAWAYAALFSLAYVHIYAEPDTRLQAVAWVKAHVPPGSTLMVEFDASTKFAIHPEWFGLDVYRLRVLDHYAPDGRRGVLWQAPPLSPEEKWAYMLRVLDRSDYVLISEAWATVFPRLPKRFPAEARFYTRLFDGTLGYRLVATFQACPRLGPWRFCDEGAELSWRYFDHPRVYIFERVKP